MPSRSVLPIRSRSLAGEARKKRGDRGPVLRGARRIAVGAQPSAIQLQFLIEAVTLSLFGGLIGVLIGVGVSLLVGALASFQPIVSTGSIVLAFGVSFTIGVFFGFYPARKAAALDPIDALRYE